MVRYLALSMLLLGAVILSGCAETSAIREDYGSSYNSAKCSQTLNPDASKNMEPVYGLDGRTAEAVKTKYEKSFEKVCEKSAYTFNVVEGK